MNVKLFSNGVGINNKVPAHRLQYDEQSGVTALENAMDVLIGRSGDIVTRQGTEKVVSGSFHSRFSLGDGSFYVVEERELDSALFRAIPNIDGSLEMLGIISKMPRTAKVDYVAIGDKVLYCNGYQNGVLADDNSSSWTSQEWTGPDSAIEMVKPPAGTHIDLLAGRALLSVKDELFYSEHGLIGLIDEAKNRIRMEGDILMVYAVQTGVYVSDSKAVYFLSGNDPNKWLCKKVLNYPAVEWGREQGLIDPSLLGLDSISLAALFATVNGPVIGMPDGSVINLIDKNVTMPGCAVQSGSIIVIDESLIIQSGV